MINIDYSRDKLLTKAAKVTLADRYLLPTEKSPQDAFARAAQAYSDSPEMAQRVYDYASKLWFMYSTPILSNGGTEKGLPISCFLNHVPDSRKGLSSHSEENIFLASNGGGIGGYWGAIRSNGAKTSRGLRSSGIVPFLKWVESSMLAFKQGDVRRGSYAAYLPVSHPEIEDFIQIRKATGGDPNLKAPELHNAVVIPDCFMERVAGRMSDPNYDDSWPLIDPHSGEVCDVVSATRLWIDILETRVATGEPYLMFVDTVNNAVPDVHKVLGLKVTQSNLCSEIVLPTNEERTAVCCLSSVNLEYYDAWRDDKLFIPTLVRFLDNVLSAFIEKAPPELKNAVNSATNERSIGLGAMGFHTFLQKKMVPFESAMAVSWNKNIFTHIGKEANEASVALGREKGHAPDYFEAGTCINPEHLAAYLNETTPRRNVYLMAVAPNATSGIIAGTSPSIEPWESNNFTHKTMSGSFTMRNKLLVQLIEERCKDAHGNDIADAKAIWRSIRSKGGSVQHLDILNAGEKRVFKTANEIDQMWVVEHAATRAPLIDQAQSVNLFFPSSPSKGYVHKVHLTAWKKGVKSLYYYRGKKIKGAEDISVKVEREIISDEPEQCLACEG